MQLKKKLSYNLLNLFHSNNNEDNTSTKHITINEDQPTKHTNKQLKPTQSLNNLNHSSFKAVFNKLVPNKRNSVIQPLQPNVTLEAPPSPTLSASSHITSSSDSSHFNDLDYQHEASLRSIPLQKIASSPISSIQGKISPRTRSNSHTTVSSQGIVLTHSRSHSSSQAEESLNEKSTKVVNKKNSFSANLSNLFKSNKTPSGGTCTKSIEFMNLNLKAPDMEVYEPFQHSLNSNHKSVVNIEEMKAKKMFFYFKLIKESLLIGQKVTDKLYIPKQAWYQNNISLCNMDEKAKRLQLLTQHFNGLMENDFNELSSVKCKLEALGSSITNFQIINKEKKKNDGYTLTEYSSILLNFLIESQHFETTYLYLLKLKKCQNTQQVNNVLHPIHCVTNYLIHTLLRELFGDITILLNHYLSSINTDLLI